MKELKKHKSFGGEVQFWEHESATTGTSMKFSTFKPEGECKGILVWLSGLTCNEENFITKAGAQRYLSKKGLGVICPDTSPRGLNLESEHDSYDFGSGAGFYVDATTSGYSDHYKMYSYIVQDIVEIANDKFNANGNISLFGHSMGGHGALTIGLKNPDLFKSVSAFAPIVNPVSVPWGKKAFAGYLGKDSVKEYDKYDACELLKNGHRHPRPLLIDQGLADDFLEEQLQTKTIESVAKECGQELRLCYREGYDHSYYYISSFIEEHVNFHAEYL